MVFLCSVQHMRLHKRVCVCVCVCVRACACDCVSRVVHVYACVHYPNRMYLIFLVTSSATCMPTSISNSSIQVLYEEQADGEP